MSTERIIQIFLELIRIDALSGMEKPVFEYAEKFLRELSLNPQDDGTAHLNGGSTGNLVCRIGNGGNMVLLAHMDTVRPTKHVKPVIDEEKISSDGTTVLGVDNRAGMAALLYALERAKAENIPLKDFTLVFTTQEETSLGGSAKLQLPDKIKYGFVFDSHLPPGSFISESVGAATFSVRITGKASHSGIAPENGINSIKAAADALSMLKFGKLDANTRANVGIIQGGSAINVVPEVTVVEGEVRSTIPSKIDKKLDEIRTKFEKAAADYGACIDFSYKWEFRPYKHSPKNKIYKYIRDIIERTGINAVPQITYGGSDANTLNERGITCINLGTGAANPHSNDEFIYIKDLVKISEIALELMKK